MDFDWIAPSRILNIRRTRVLQSKNLAAAAAEAADAAAAIAAAAPPPTVTGSSGPTSARPRSLQENEEDLLMARFSGQKGRRKPVGLTAEQTEAVLADLMRSLDGRRRLKPIAGGQAPPGKASSSASGGPWLPTGSPTGHKPGGSAAAAALALRGSRSQLPSTSATPPLVAEDIPKETILKLHARRLRLQVLSRVLQMAICGSIPELCLPFPVCSK